MSPSLNCHTHCEKVSDNQESYITHLEALCDNYLMDGRIEDTWIVVSEAITTDIGLMSDYIMEVLINLLERHEALFNEMECLHRLQKLMEVLLKHPKFDDILALGTFMYWETKNMSCSKAEVDSEELMGKAAHCLEIWTHWYHSVDCQILESNEILRARLSLRFLRKVADLAIAHFQNFTAVKSMSEAYCLAQKMKQWDIVRDVAQAIVTLIPQLGLQCVTTKFCNDTKNWDVFMASMDLEEDGDLLNLTAIATHHLKTGQLKNFLTVRDAVYQQLPLSCKRGDAKIVVYFAKAVIKRLEAEFLMMPGSRSLEEEKGCIKSMQHALDQAKSSYYFIYVLFSQCGGKSLGNTFQGNAVWPWQLTHEFLCITKLVGELFVYTGHFHKAKPYFENGLAVAHQFKLVTWAAIFSSKLVELELLAEDLKAAMNMLQRAQSFLICRTSTLQSGLQSCHGKPLINIVSSDKMTCGFKMSQLKREHTPFSSWHKCKSQTGSSESLNYGESQNGSPSSPMNNTFPFQLRNSMKASSNYDTAADLRQRMLSNILNQSGHCKIIENNQESGESGQNCFILTDINSCCSCCHSEIIGVCINLMCLQAEILWRKQTSICSIANLLKHSLHLAHQLVRVCSLTKLIDVMCDSGWTISKVSHGTQRSNRILVETAYTCAKVYFWNLYIRSIKAKIACDHVEPDVDFILSLLNIVEAVGKKAGEFHMVNVTVASALLLRSNLNYLNVLKTQANDAPQEAEKSTDNNCVSSAFDIITSALNATMGDMFLDETRSKLLLPLKEGSRFQPDQSGVKPVTSELMDLQSDQSHKSSITCEIMDLQSDPSHKTPVTSELMSIQSDPSHKTPVTSELMDLQSDQSCKTPVTSQLMDVQPDHKTPVTSELMSIQSDLSHKTLVTSELMSIQSDQSYKTPVTSELMDVQPDHKTPITSELMNLQSDQSHKTPVTSELLDLQSDPSHKTPVTSELMNLQSDQSHKTPVTSELMNLQSDPSHKTPVTSELMDLQSDQSHKTPVIDELMDLQPDHTVIDSPSISASDHQADKTVDSPSISASDHQADKTVDSPSISASDHQADKTDDSPSISASDHQADKTDDSPSISASDHQADKTDDSPSISASDHQTDKTDDSPSISASDHQADKTDDSPSISASDHQADKTDDFPSISASDHQADKTDDSPSLKSCLITEVACESSNTPKTTAEWDSEEKLHRNNTEHNHTEAASCYSTHNVSEAEGKSAIKDSIKDGRVFIPCTEKNRKYVWLQKLIVNFPSLAALQNVTQRINYLQRAVQQFCEFPHSILHRQISQSLALCLWEKQMTDECNTNQTFSAQVEIAAYLTDSMHMTFQHMMTENFCYKLRKPRFWRENKHEEAQTNKKAMKEALNVLRFGGDVMENFHTRLASVPDDWTVVQMTIVNFDPSNPGRGQLFVTRLHRDQEPITVGLPNHRCQFLAYAQKAYEVGITQCHDDCRLRKSQHLVDALIYLQEIVLGGHKWLLRGQLDCVRQMSVQTFLDEAGRRAVNFILQQHGYLICYAGLRNLLEILLEADEADVLSLVECMWPPHLTGTLTTIIMDAQKNVARLCEGWWRKKRGPVILILDNELTRFPWESMPDILSDTVTRMPSFASLVAVLTWHTKMSSSPFTSGVERTNVTANVPFTKDIIQTSREQLVSDLKKYTDWQIDTKHIHRSDKTLEPVLRNSSLYLYFGHSWEDYRVLQNILGRAFAMLISCDSGSLSANRNRDGDGPPLYFLMIGCPAVMGTLWNVYGQDSRRLISHISSSWMSQRKPVSIRDLIVPATKTVLLYGLCGSGLVTYGLPLMMN